MIPKQLSMLIRDIKFAMLTTYSPDGSLRCRPMVTQVEEGDDYLWFYTGKLTHKAMDIEAHPLVNVSFSDAASQRYVSVSGSATLIDDEQAIKARWRPTLAAWIPKGRDHPDLALLRISIDHVEFWQPPTTWQSRTIAMTDSNPDPEAGKGDS